MSSALKRCGAMLAALVWIVMCTPAMAVEQVSGELEGIGRVLLLQDCQKDCQKFETQFSSGDADRLRAELRANRYAEVWLNSGGGNSDEGQRVGRVLREFGMAVRVRRGHNCASACTVAFLGGVLRTVDEGGNYLVHSRSGHMTLDKEDVNRMLSGPESELERFVLRMREENRRFIGERLAYIQGMLGGRPDASSYAQVMRLDLDRRPAYFESPGFARDVGRIRVERQAGLHAVMLQLERDSFDEALSHVQPHLSQLGSRAEAAHRMMSAMFSTSIVRTAALTPETLKQLGFVTPQLPR